jgi:hypothetical protein
MEPLHQYKTFMDAYAAINKDYKDFYPFLEDNRISQAEKKLLKALLHIKKAQSDRALAILLDLKDSRDFILGYKHFLLGIVYNHNSNYLSSSKHLVKSIKIFEKYPNPFHLYKPISIMSMVYFNLKDAQRLKRYHTLFLKIKNESIGHEILDCQYKTYIAILDDDRENSIIYIDKLINEYSAHTKNNISFYIILKLMVEVQNKDYDRCYELLDEYKESNGIKIKSNYIYILNLLNFITKDNSIYVYKNDFENSDYTFNQLKVIQSLSLRNKKDAIKHWKKLSEANPGIYKSKYVFSGGKNLFSLSLSKLLNTNILKDMDKEVDHSYEVDLSLIKKNIDKLEYILDKDVYINKDELIKLIWNEEWSTKNDGRLRTLISRLKKKKSITIDVKDGKYKKIA